jgi:hypothetical protein
MQLHHEGKIVLNSLGSVLFPQFGEYLQPLLFSRPRYHSSSAMIANVDLSFGTFHMFLPKRLHQVQPK